MKSPLKISRSLLLIVLAWLLINGLLAGLARLGWAFAAPAASLAALHGPLMICGVLGSLIGLERALASKTSWSYLAPVLSLAASLGLMLGLASPIAAACFVSAALIQLGLLGKTLHHKPTLALALQSTGLLCWLSGSLLWLANLTMSQVALWWAGFLLLTIAGSRLDKSLRPGLNLGLGLAAGLYLGGLILTLREPQSGLVLAGLGLLVSAAELLRQDPACKKSSGSSALMRACLLSGYCWLGFGGLLLLSGPQALQGFYYDMTLHSLFVGFVFSLIFGHLPQLLPRLLNQPEVQHRSLWLPLLLLQLSLGLRLAGGLWAYQPLRAWGALLNVGALLAYGLTILWLLKTRRQQTS